MAPKFFALKKAWIARSVHATHTSYSRGVSVLLAKSLPVEIIQVKTDPEVRFIILSLQIGRTVLTLVNLYAPLLFHRHSGKNLIVQT